MIYDNEVFFENYQKMRINDTGLNGKMEEPCIRQLIGDVSNLKVLDIGSGFGHQAIWLKSNNAMEVVALDPSANMIEYSKNHHHDMGIEFVHGYYEDQTFENGFDLILSSMALHYVENLDLFFSKCFRDLNDGGRLIFSMEHPVCTANPEGYREDENGKYWRLNNYFNEGERTQKWFVEGVKKHHRKVSTIINSLISCGFKIKKIEEPHPLDKDYLESEKKDDYFWVRPSIVVIKVEK
jgi:ubiquinone/menaquinone biosynthesis C-methylase UbiE